jgi:pilus assembly protein CpaB
VVSIRVDAVSSSSGMILPGDRVDMLVHVAENHSKGVHEARTQTFLQNVKVFAVDDLFSRNDEATVSAKTISLLVTPDQAELVMLAGQLGTVQLVMRSASDESHEPTSGADVQELLSGTNTGIPYASGARPDSKEGLLSLLGQPKEPEPTPTIVEQPAPPTKNSFKMLLIKGPTAETLEFEDENGLPLSTSVPAAPATIGAGPADGPDAADAPDDAPAEEPTAADEPAAA